MDKSESESKDCADRYHISQLNTMDKICVRSNAFNVEESFRKFREYEGLFDVTLATEDGQEIKAHKIILSAGSYFFSDIFLRNNHSNMYIFLKGVSKPELLQVTEFLYNGEASISKDEVREKMNQNDGWRGEEDGI